MCRHHPISCRSAPAFRQGALEIGGEGMALIRTQHGRDFDACAPLHQRQPFNAEFRMFLLLEPGPERIEPNLPNSPRQLTCRNSNSIRDSTICS